VVLVDVWVVGGLSRKSVREGAGKNDTNIKFFLPSVEIKFSQRASERMF
jgi:hypothetical protein